MILNDILLQENVNIYFLQTLVKCIDPTIQIRQFSIVQPAVGFIKFSLTFDLKKGQSALMAFISRTLSSEI